MKKENKRYIIIDLEDKAIVDDVFQVITNNDKETTTILSNWNSGYSIMCDTKENLKKDIIEIIESEINE